MTLTSATKAYVVWRNFRRGTVHDLRLLKNGFGAVVVVMSVAECSGNGAPSEDAVLGDHVRGNLVSITCPSIGMDHECGFSLLERQDYHVVHEELLCERVGRPLPGRRPCRGLGLDIVSSRRVRPIRHE